MSIPLDRLYNYLDSLLDEDTIIYRFLPHGSKNLADLTILKIYKNQWGVPIAICHDQEPLNFDYYTLPENVQPTIDRVIEYSAQRVTDSVPCWYYATVADAKMQLLNSNLRAALADAFNQYDNVLLIHSEQRSSEVEKYQRNNYIGIYWWSHALIALDWYRYAQHDPLLMSTRTHHFDFLIYNRSWTGTREYRLKFSELLIDYSLVQHCNTKFSPVDSTINYKDHEFSNPVFKLIRSDLESYFQPNTVDPTASADYQAEDYASSAIEVVLETLFDDSRLHLTEKTLRPIACKQPFILVATHGSLEYLRRYGFKTFNGLIDETYDTIADPAKRLQAVVNEMKRISTLPAEEKTLLFDSLQAIAEENYQRFFSGDFFEFCINEFKINAEQGLKKLRSAPMGINRNNAYNTIHQKYSNEFLNLVKANPALQEKINSMNAFYQESDRQPKPNTLTHQHSTNSTDSN